MNFCPVGTFYCAHPFMQHFFSCAGYTEVSPNCWVPNFLRAPISLYTKYSRIPISPYSYHGLSSNRRRGNRGRRQREIRAIHYSKYS